MIALQCGYHSSLFPVPQEDSSHTQRPGILWEVQEPENWYPVGVPTPLQESQEKGNMNTHSGGSRRKRHRRARPLNFDELYFLKSSFVAVCFKIRLTQIAQETIWNTRASRALNPIPIGLFRGLESIGGGADLAPPPQISATNGTDWLENWHSRKTSQVE